MHPIHTPFLSFCLAALVCTLSLSADGAKWDFGSNPGRNDAADFVKVNTSTTNGQWSLDGDSLRFNNYHVSSGADRNNFTEAAAVVDLSKHGFRAGEDFTVSMLFDAQGISEWNRFGLIALAPDMRGHEYQGRGFYHAMFRLHSRSEYNLRIGNEFSGDRPLVSIPMPDTFTDGTYQFTLIGNYNDSGALSLRIEVQQEGQADTWVVKTADIAQPFEGTWFGFGGRFRAYPGARQPDFSVRSFSYKPQAKQLPTLSEDPITFTDQWSHSSGNSLYRVRVRNAAHSYRPLPVVIYLRNLPIPRIGSDSDDAIMEDLMNDGLVVIEVDCRGLPAGFPDLQNALMEFNDNLVQRISLMSGGVITPDISNIHWLPEGYRLSRNVPFWNIEKHGAPGSLEQIVRTWNSHVVNIADVDPITTAEALHGPGGEPLDYNLYMDIAYPSGTPAQSVSTIAHFSTQSILTRAFREHRAIYPITWLTSGYALVYVDHVYNPLARSRYYGHFGPYSLQNLNGIAAGSAAIRYLRTHSDNYNLNGRIGALGHSKSSYTVSRLADLDHPHQNEWTQQNVPPSPKAEPQPWPDASSEIQVAYSSMGDGTRRTRLYNSNMVPLLTAAGLHDQYDEWRRFPALVSALEDVGLHHYAFWMEELGHTYPSGTDLASGQNRTGMVKQFFDQHLHPRGEPDPLQVLAIIPAEGNDSVDRQGISRYIMAEDDKLPVDMHGLPATKPLTVVFSRKVDPATVNETTLYLEATQTGSKVPGEWRASLQNARFQFYPAAPLRPGTNYRIVVQPGIQDKLGTTLAAPRHQGFTTTR
jgi:hypothetical protein